MTGIVMQPFCIKRVHKLYIWLYLCINSEFTAFLFRLCIDRAGFKCIITDYKTDEEAKELYDACIKADLLPLCRSVISSPRDKFDGAFKDAGLAAAYNECAFAVVGHEISTVFDLNGGLFSSDGLNLAETIKLYSRISAKGNKTNE